MHRFGGLHASICRRSFLPESKQVHRKVSSTGSHSLDVRGSSTRWFSTRLLLTIIPAHDEDLEARLRYALYELLRFKRCPSRVGGNLHLQSFLVTVKIVVIDRPLL